MNREKATIFEVRKEAKKLKKLKMEAALEGN